LLSTFIFGQLPYDDIYYVPGDDEPQEVSIKKYYYNKTPQTYSTHTTSISFGFNIGNYPWYYDPYYYGWNYYQPYYYGWNYYRPYYYNWGYYYTPYYYGWNYYKPYHYKPYNNNRYYGPRNSNNRGTTVRPTYQKPRNETPKYQKPRNRYEKTGTSPKYRYNNQYQNGRSVDYIRIRTNDNKNIKQNKTRDRRSNSPQYWNQYNNMSKPAPTKQRYQPQQRTTPKTYNNQQRYRPQPRSTPNTRTQPKKR